ncbi:pre-peptidase C-terminal domain-containing protein [Lysobacter sp. SG-8]|uniref:Pre-peptidase C-terminal domain-containing protein n=1 Tax=Marilutibacter penaei TaxID=2759900 RepID=A0A7W3U358_9GAMM|nr:PilC/PilY family type IV pilus protein [Lysobacter penaei]MBB1088044.1 pre-peptidase C-terminal domain-containing protein [Lysobacter penaei]
MNTKSSQNGRATGVKSRLSAMLCAFAATMMSFPSAAALNVPAVPLQVGTPLPPNIMLILDDSGSMDWTFMPGPFAASAAPLNNQTSPVSIGLETYAHNTLYYDPSIDYTPWILADGSYHSGGTTLNSVWTDAALASSNASIANRVHTYYVPKTPGTNLDRTNGFYRYQIHADGSVWRSEYTGASSRITLLNQGGIWQSNNNWRQYQVDVPSGVYDLEITTSGGGGDADLYVRRGAQPTTSNYDCRERSNGNNHTCEFDPPQAGRYYIGLFADSTFNNVNLNVSYVASRYCGADDGWNNCTRVTPNGRSEQAEANNFATWYSYHRTRMKAAKAGAGSAFADLNGGNYRVGFTTIWGPSQSDRNAEFLINVGSNNGLFENRNGSTNRTTWFNRLYDATANNGTPLHNALRRMGLYYSDDLAGYGGTSGPYGPEASPLACRQNFSILTTDGYWNQEDSIVYSGNDDGNDGATYSRPDGTSEQSYVAAAPYRDNFSKTLADVAMKYWKTDLMPGMDNIVPTTTVNPAFWQHMVTFGISLGLKGTLPQTSVADVLQAQQAGTFPGWPNPTDNEDDHRIDDLLHAAVNGHGAFAAASNPTEFAMALRSALASIDERTSSASNLSFNSSVLNNDTVSYSANFVAGQWIGDVTAYSTTSAGAVNPPLWRASNGIPTTPSSRRIRTYGGATGTRTAATAFPTAAQETVLTTAVANYIKGDRTGEGSTYRARATLFGDIVNSSPVYVETGSDKTIYVGANDGMLHAINAENGAERFAYVPKLLDMARLKDLSRRVDFVHQYFVDGPISVSTRVQTPNKNYLVGTLGRGGRGVYGLDVTDPTTFATSGQSWEFAGDNDMGMVLGKPLIAKVNIGTNGTMAAIVANGINSPNDRAALFVINLATGALIQKITTNAETANGLSVPTGVDANGDGKVDTVYAGDLQGNVWRFDLSASTSTSWSSAKLFTATYKDDPTRRQPITGGITVAYNPATYNPWVFFGTGRYILETDPGDTSTQTWYGMEDNGTAITGRAQLKEREIVLAGVLGGNPVRAFEETTSGDMNGTKGWYVELLTPPDYTAEGERMIGDQFVVSGNVLVASSVIPRSDGCDTTGRGYLNFIDAFTGGALSAPFIDANGDGVIDHNDTLPSGTGGGGTDVPVGSIDLGIGMPTDPGALIGSGGEAVFCANGSTGAPGCVPFEWGPGFGRISWRELLRD